MLTDGLHDKSTSSSNSRRAVNTIPRAPLILVRLNPSDAELRNALGNALAAKGAADAALAQYREALRLQPDFTDIRNTPLSQR